VLSRLAESLYWIGRYVERADATARILDVHLQLLLEDRRVDEAAACRALLDVMGVTDLDGKEASASLVVQLLAGDAENPSSIIGSLRAARSNARGARDAISSEMWESLNATYHALPDLAELVGVGPHALFRFAKERTAVLAGLADSSMVRDGGWHFLILGRSLERVDMTARLLEARYGELWGPTGWVTMLRCCAAHEAYLRTHQRAVDGSLAAGFLLLDRLFPRSIYHALRTAEGALVELDPQAERGGVPDDARRILGRVRTQLEYHTPDELLTDLPRLLFDIQSAAARTGLVVAERYFRQTRALEWQA
jgi:uncharacterized alpha-E superfamily protein